MAWTSIQFGGSMAPRCSYHNNIRNTNTIGNICMTNRSLGRQAGILLRYRTVLKGLYPKTRSPSLCFQRSRGDLALIPRASSSEVPVTFRIKRKLEYGESHTIVGNHPSLGNWKLSKGAQMSWGEHDQWRVQVSLPIGTKIEFKCVKIGGDSDPEWESGRNHEILIDDNVQEATIMLSWSNSVQVSLNESPFSEPTYNSDNDDTSSPTNTATTPNNNNNNNNAASYVVSSSSSDNEDRLPSLQWSGKDTVFMASNQHTNDRQGIWNTQGLTGPALHLVQGDEKSGSWLGKLSTVKSLLVDNAHALRPDKVSLAYAYVYLTWVATGALPCVEQGGHRRPNHHANLGQTTFRSLEWTIGDRPGTVDSLIARRLHTRLPAFDDAYTQGTPLTRIRDIAHRNDIPQWLKQEIKHTIQNKLHRNAGPEDLVATEALLARVTANPGEYPDSFIHELKIFVTELRDFFNASSLGDRLHTIEGAFDDAGNQMSQRFVAAKRALDEAGPGADENMIMDALHSATSIRALLGAGLASGLRNDAPDGAMSMRQRWRLAEIKAEDYVFVLMSRFINKVEEKGGSFSLVQGNDGAWGLPIGALVIGLRHLGLCGYDPSECMALERELATWQRLGGLSHPDEALRLRATLQRLQRLTENYCQVLLDALTEPAKVLGVALGIEEERYAVFVEAEIRSNVVFQLSKLAGILLKATTEIAGVTPWSVVVGGNAQGVLIRVSSLDPGCLDAAGDRDALLLVDNATGDEEVGALGPRLRGIILCHDIPHLSHLGVRARQERVPFVTCNDAAAVEETLRGNIGNVVGMIAEVDGVRFGDASLLHGALPHSSSGGEEETPVSSSTSSSLDPPLSSSSSTSFTPSIDTLSFISLDEAIISTSGAKATACGMLSSLSRECISALQQTKRPDSDNDNNDKDRTPIFEAPHGVVMPFGSMDAALKEDRENNRDISKRLSGLIAQAETLASSLVTTLRTGNGSSVNDEIALGVLCDEITSLIASISLPQTFLQKIGSVFDPGCTVIVRSSANVEDLQGMSGAGLYDSIPNKNPKDPKSLQDGITRVWASLYSRRAVLARAAGGVLPGTACMAVVVQEQLAPELSFVLHTAHPVTKNPSILVAEIAPGLGETLASGTRGTGWRMEVERENGDVRTLSFANFSKAFMPTSKNGSSGSGSSFDAADAFATDTNKGNGTAGATSSVALLSGVVSLQTVDYSEQELSWSEDMRSGLGKRLAVVGRLLEHEFGGPQDVEGCIADGRLFVVQSRPQP